MFLNAHPSSVRPSRVYLEFRKESWTRPICLHFRPEEARAIARALMTVQRRMERQKKARWRMRSGI